MHGWTGWMVAGGLLAALSCDDGADAPQAEPVVVGPTFPTSCVPAAPCGGDPSGAWVWADWCRDEEGQAEPIGGGCNEFTSSTAHLAPVGDLTFNADGSYQASTIYTHRRVAPITPGCLAPGCAQEAGRFIDWAEQGRGGGGGGMGEPGQFPGAWRCVAGDGDECDCTSDTVLEGAPGEWQVVGLLVNYAHHAVIDDAAAGRWSQEGSTLTLIDDDGRTRALWFCVDGDTLTLRDLRADVPSDPVFVMRRR